LQEPVAGPVGWKNGGRDWAIDKLKKAMPETLGALVRRDQAGTSRQKKWMPGNLFHVGTHGKASGDSNPEIQVAIYQTQAIRDSYTLVHSYFQCVPTVD
jgi:hypothetical protein